MKPIGVHHLTGKHGTCLYILCFPSKFTDTNILQAYDRANRHHRCILCSESAQHHCIHGSTGEVTMLRLNKNLIIILMVCAQMREKYLSKFIDCFLLPGIFFFCFHGFHLSCLDSSCLELFLDSSYSSTFYGLCDIGSLFLADTKLVAEIETCVL